MRKINKIILHCSATKEGIDIKTGLIRSWHKDRGFSDIGYHYVIELDGTVHEGRSEEVIGAHCKGHNSFSIGICYVGGLDKNGKSKDTRTPCQKVAMYDLVGKLLEKYNLTIEDVYCHNQFAKKDCPCFSRDNFIKEYYEYAECE